MSITIKRNTGWMEKHSYIGLKLNGEEVVANIVQEKPLEIEIPEGENNLKTSNFLARSNTIEVEDGDIVKITQTTFSKIAYPFFLLALILTDSMKYKIIVGVILITCILLLTTYDLAIVKEENSQNL